MTDRELIQQALKALETCKVHGEDHDEWLGFSEERVGAAVTALRERLAQPEQPMVVSPECAERGCMAHDDRVDGPGVVVQPTGVLR